MSVFVVRHQHPADRCPATDCAAGAGLLNHLSGPSATRHGVRIRGEAVLAAHTLVMIAEADGEDVLRAFLRPFEAVGTVEVEPASTCAQVVAGGCGSALPTADREARAVDPEKACIAARRRPGRAQSVPAELRDVASRPGRRRGDAQRAVLRRNHFGIPDLDPGGWRLRVGGLVERPLSLGLVQLRAMRSASEVVTLECAGNGRAGLEPPAPGEQWGVGAASTAEWTGVPLTEVLDRPGCGPGPARWCSAGADRGQMDGRDGQVHFERSMPVDQLGHAGALLAYAMNGEELPLYHGHPLRLVASGWSRPAGTRSPR